MLKCICFSNEMASLIRKIVANHLGEAVLKNPNNVTQSWAKNAERVPWCIRYLPVAKRTKPGQAQLAVSYTDLQAVGALSRAKWSDLADWAHTVTTQLPMDSCVKRTDVKRKGIAFEVDSATVIKKCLKEIVDKKEVYGFQSDLHCYSLGVDDIVMESKKPQNIVVEYSSPNIAKPFHAGHLRSTIIGSVIGNAFRNLGHHVTTINFLGNWGTQFGLLGVGYKKYGCPDKLRTDPLQHLFEIYVRINKEAAGDDVIKQQAREFFTHMEQGDVEAVELWQKCMDVSVEEYAKMYKRLGVTFDRYDGEAMYVNKAQHLIEDLRGSGVLEIDSSTGVGYVDVSSPDTDKRTIYANLVRSDGASLYITRDIAAALDRYDKYKFDRHLYVVENSQHSHFEQLVLVLRRLGHAWARRPLKDFHVKFGRVEGMSTRHGDVVLLRDILDEAKDRMLVTMKEKQSTKVHGKEDMDRVADILATSAIIVQDLKQKRLQNYTFSWERMLDFKGDTGVSLQYTHARLRNIEVNCGVALNSACDVSPLTEPSAVNLVLHLARYDEVLHNLVVELEPCQLVHYLFQLSHLVHVASDELYVRGQPPSIAEARLLLFHSARIVLRSGLQTLGIQPLDVL